LAEAIAALPSRWAVSCYDATNNGIRVAQAIQDGTAIAISNGSFKEGFGTSALVIEASDSTDNIIAVNVVPSNLANQGSYGSELAGIFDQITLVNALCNVHGITQGSIECGCDGAGALNKVFNPDSEAKTDGSQFNLLSTTCAALKASPIQWKYRHIQGHQGDLIDAKLDRWALLNIEMDSLAKMHWLKMLDQPPPRNCTFPDEHWPIFITDRKIHSRLHNSLYKEIY
jgi:hypothetical protein